MDIPINFSVNKAIILLKKVKIGNIVGFAEIHFSDISNNVVFKVKGFTIKLKQFISSSPAKICVDFPAFRSIRGKNGFMTSFVLEDKGLWKMIVQAILQKYAEDTGGITPGELQNQEDVDPNEVPF